MCKITGELFNNITIFVGSGTGVVQTKPPRDFNDISIASLFLISALIAVAIVIWVNKKK